MNAVRALLDKIDQLLTTEPARMIGYGAAVVIFLVLQVLNARGITILGPNLSFEESLGIAASAIAILVAVVESVRRAVYSPQTFIEQLADQAMRSYQAGHVDAHQEEDDYRAAQADAAVPPQPQTFTAVIGSAKADGSSDKTN